MSVCLYIYIYIYICLYTSVWVWEGMPEITNFIELKGLLEAGGHSTCQEFQVMKLSYSLPFSQAVANGIYCDQVKSVPCSLLSPVVPSHLCSP